MKIAYPYNEILPKKTAHDTYVFTESLFFAQQGIETALLCGRGSWEEALLLKHYGGTPSPHFSIYRLPILRKNNGFRWTYNRLFFFFSQQMLKKLCPNFVFLSVLKQAAYHLQRKLSGVRYIYEVHQLSYYPHHTFLSPDFFREKNVLEKADLITVTTAQLKNILKSPPYSLKVPIAVIPLGVSAQKLPPPPKTSTPVIAYSGQLYPEQGIDFLLQALPSIDNLHCKVYGGTSQEIALLEAKASSLKVKEKITFLGFQPPAALSTLLQEAQAFIAPFSSQGRMPYVAHTKLLEYAQWGRPIIAPNLPIVTEHFEEGREALLFEKGNVSSLISCLKKMANPSVRFKLQENIQKHIYPFTWKKRIIHYQEIMKKWSRS